MVSFLRRIIIAAAVLIIVLEFFGARDYLNSPSTGISHHNLKVRKIEKDGPNRNTPIEYGDRVVAVNGVRVRNINHYKYLTYKNTELEPFTFTIERGDSLYNVKVDAVERPQTDINQKFGLMISGFTFILVGFIVVLKRPDLMGILFSVNCLLISFILTRRPITSIPLFHITGELIYDLFFIFLPACFLHFFLVFPGRDIKKGSRRSKAERYLYYPPAVIYVISFVLALWNYSSSVRHSIINAHEAVASIYWVVYMVLCPIVFIRTYATSNRALKTKFRIVTFGLAIGILPITIMMIVMQIDPDLIAHDKLYLSGVSLSFISISFGYAILKHDAFNLRMVFRTGIVYFILPVLFTAIYYVTNEVTKGGISKKLGMNHYYFSAIFIVFFAVIFIPARSFIFRIVDRYFYKRRGVIGKEFIDFSHNIRLCKTIESVIRMVGDEVVELFRPRNVLIFVRERENNHSLSYEWPGENRMPITNIPHDVELIRQATRKRYPLMVEYFDNLWLKNNLDRISREIMQISGCAIVSPVLEAEQMIGFLIVGRKIGGGVYSSRDAELLNFISERTAASVRNIELSMANMEKEELENELRIASSIQNRLLPGSPPALTGATLGARIRPSKHVGGDFYDFFKLSAGVTAFIVSDIAGKGIPAAFLMSSLQAYLRAEAVIERSPSEVLESVNSYMFEKSDSIRHATLFYSVYEEEEGILKYSNAGGIPPVLFRADGTTGRLKRGGLVIGVDENAEYMDGAVKLNPSDMILAFTDGVIDQEDEEGNQFGYQNLVEFVRDNIDIPVDTLLENLFSRLMIFGNDKMKDDMTVIALKRDTE